MVLPSHKLHQVPVDHWSGFTCCSEIKPKLLASEHQQHDGEPPRSLYSMVLMMFWGSFVAGGSETLVKMMFMGLLGPILS